MRTPLFTLVLLCAFAYSFAQTNLKDLRPAELVSETKKQGKAFQNVALFSLAVEQKNTDSELDQRIGRYDLLQLEAKSLRNFLEDTPAAMSFKVPTKTQGDLELELVQVSILSDDFAVIESGTTTPAEVEVATHYRGVIKGDPNSLVAISVFEDEIMGLISSPSIGNLVIGKLEQRGPVAQHVIYNDDDVFQQEDFLCGTPDDGPQYTPEELLPNASRSAAGCVRIYFEVDYDIYQNKGGTTGATNYVTGIFNQVATLYANENVNVVISEIYMWTNPSPYNGTSSSQLLNQFQSIRTSFNGDLAQLLSYKASGGIAVLNGLCHPYTSAKLSFSSVNTSYNTVPTYSFTVMVVTHELGHLLGSHHTHACVWNGNNTAIDGCAGFTEGGCPNPGNPSGGGTIMSYCHISSAGINFNLGLGTQPGNVIRNKVAAASCLQTCGTGGGGNDGGGNNGGGNNGGGSNSGTCSDNAVIFRLVLDNYGTETTWRLRNGAGSVVESGGPYEKGKNGTQIRDTFCLPDGCYTFEIFDSYGDGICCAYGNGVYSLTTLDGKTIKTGGSFGSSETTNFCVPGSTGGGGNDGGGNNSNCTQIDFKNYSINSYGGGQDIGTYTLLNNGAELKIQNNAWKSIALNYTVTANTVLEFEFGSTLMGEVHGIGFDNDNNISANRTFKLYGTQAWGIQNFNNYPGDNTWRRYVIPVGQFYTGQFDRLFFVCDNDSGNRNGNSYFRNIKIYEGASCQAIVGEGSSNSLSISSDNNFTEMPGLMVFPNPAKDRLTLNFRSKEDGDATVQIFNMVGQRVKALPIPMYEGINDAQIDIDDLPSGTYLIRIDTRVNQLVSKFNVSR